MTINYGDQPEKNEAEKPEPMVKAKQGQIHFPYKFYPLLITVTWPVQELLKSDEAKSYLKGVERESRKLLAMFDRECIGSAIQPTPMSAVDHINRLEAFLDKNVPTWRNEIMEEEEKDDDQSDDRST